MIRRIIMAAASLALTAGWVQAQEVKVGVVLPYTGIGAEFAQLVDRGMEQYLKLNADKLKPYKIRLIKRDAKNPGGADARTAVQELLTQDKVDALAGWIYSPNAIASAPVVSAGKKLAVIMNAGTAHITQMAPNYVRTSFSMWHAGFSMGEAAAKILKAKTAVVGYSDFPPGKDSLNAFKRGFEANGGKVIDEIPMGGPAAVPDFTPFFQRAKDKKPDVFFVFMPAGDHAAATVRTFNALGMRQAGIKLIGPGDITQDIKLQLHDDAAHRVSELPYGRQRLIELAIALGLKPEVLLLDEPAAGVPSAESHIILDAIDGLPKQIGVLIIEHDMDVVFRFAQRITVLVGGAVFAEGTPKDIGANEDVRAVYLGQAHHD